MDFTVSYPKRARVTDGKSSKQLLELILLEALGNECTRLHTMPRWAQRDPFATTLGVVGHIDESWWNELPFPSLPRRLNALARAGLVRRKKWTYGRSKYQLSDRGARCAAELAEQLALRSQLPVDASDVITS